MDIRAELTHRIRKDEQHFGGSLPENTTIAWRGYLAGLLEWNVIDLLTYEALTALLPGVADDPAVAILQGRE
jgi:hypothetical protein